MKLRRRPAPLLLFLIPALASILVSATSDGPSSGLSKDREPRDAKVADAVPTVVAGQPTLKSAPKSDVGTKDAPVDGKDGKPKVGPFVGTEKDSKKQKPEDGELVTKQPGTVKTTPKEPTTVDGKAIPEVNDGVMNDPSRQLPKQGTTGTEGGVSEKDKAQKAQEGQTGEKAEKKPNSPKEPPRLPHSEQEKITKGEKEAAKKEKEATKKNKDKDAEVDEAAMLSGIEVCLLMLLAHSRSKLT
jgi:hypothetical protein